MSTLEAVRTTKDVASRISELFKENKWEQVQKEFFADNCESIEPRETPGLKSVKGIEAIKIKGKEFNSQVEAVHDGWVSEPIIAGNFIAFAMGMDVTMKGAGRVQMDEIAIYEVKDGKIVREQFFY